MTATLSSTAARVALGLARRFWLPLVFLLTLEALGAALSVVAPVPLQAAFDTAAAALGHDKSVKPLPLWLSSLAMPLTRAFSGEKLAALAVLSVALTILTQCQSLVSGLLSTAVGQRVVRALRQRLLDAALRLPLSRHIERGTADTLYRIQTDSQAAEWMLLDGALPIFTAFTTLIAMLLALFSLDLRLGLVGIAVAPPLLLAARLFKPALKAGAKDARQKESRALGAITESLGALTSIKAYGREAFVTDRYAQLAEEGVAARLKVSLYDGSLGLGVQTLCAIGTATALFVSLSSVRAGNLSVGEALLALHYIGQVYGPLKTLGKKWASVQTQWVGLERAAALLDEPVEAPEKPDALSLQRARGAIRFETVTFGYDARRPVLRGLNLTVSSGERIGIVGPTGAGKSTLMALLLRLYDPMDGAVFVDEIETRDLKVADLRRQFAVVFQETVLFSGTIAENIAIGKPDATRDEIEFAARAAHLHESLSRFPDGYDTPVGERGAALSGGERQRVGLARAFLRDAPILILDEPTSALDSVTEAGVLDAMEALMTGRTTLIVTHRDAALRHCDRVLELHDGYLKTRDATLR